MDGCNNPYLHLSDEERLRQIGEILHLAVRLYWRRERLAGRVAPAGMIDQSEPRKAADLTDDETEKNILRYLTRMVSAPPTQIGAELGLTRSTLGRKLARLKRCGLVMVLGKTKGARYGLAGPPGRN